MSTTFDPNRVGPGTFELVQDPSTGVYSLKQVGFTKLPSLTLPTLGGTSTATTTTKQTTKQAESTADTGPKVIQPTGGAEDRVEIPTIGPIPGGARDDAAKVSQNLQSAFLASGAAGGARLPSTSPQEGFLASGAAGGASLQVDENKVDLGNPTGDPRVVSEEQGLVGKPAMLGDIGASMDQMSGAGAAKVPDAVKFGQPSLPDRNIIQKASDLIKNSASLKLAETGLKMAGTVATGIGDAILGVTDVDRRRREADDSAARSLGLKTRGELGSSVDPGRIAMSPADHVLGGLNRNSAKGDLSKAASDRITTRMSAKTQQRLVDKYGSPDHPKVKEFNNKTKEFQKQANDFNSKKEAEKTKKGTKSQNPNLRAGASGGGSNGGCFIKVTLITMFDGSKKPVEQVELGDNVAVGGKVFAVGKFLNTELYNYKGIKVSGSHMVNEDGVWLRVRDTKHGKSLGDNLNTVYVFGSENRRILINDILFTDYFEVSEQDQLINNEKNFFNNWKSYGTIIDKHNVNTLNAN